MTSGPEKPRRLGRGLEALRAARATPAAPGAATGGGEGERGGESASERQRIRIAQVRPNRLQPRKEFRAEELAGLEASLRSAGLLQPITVRPVSGGGYELIAGERRLRA